MIALQAFLDPQSKVFSPQNIYLAEADTGHKLVGGATWTSANRALPQDLMGGVAVCLDDRPSAWQDHPRQQTSVGPGRVHAIGMISLPGFTIDREAAHYEAMLAGIEWVQQVRSTMTSTKDSCHTRHCTCV